MPTPLFLRRRKNTTGLLRRPCGPKSLHRWCFFRLLLGCSPTANPRNPMCTVLLGNGQQGFIHAANGKNGQAGLDT